MKNNILVENVLSLLGRILLVFTFLWAGLGKILSMEQVEMVIIDAGIPFPYVFLIVSILLELILSLAIILGMKTRLASAVLAIYLVIFTFIFHGDMAQPIQRLVFIQNMAILGGVIYVFLHGPGEWSLDSKYAMPFSIKEHNMPDLEEISQTKKEA